MCQVQSGMILIILFFLMKKLSSILSYFIIVLLFLYQYKQFYFLDKNLYYVIHYQYMQASFYVRIQVQNSVFPIIPSFKIFRDLQNIYFMDSTQHFFSTVLCCFDDFSVLLTKFNPVVSHDNHPLPTFPRALSLSGFTYTF